MCNDSDFIYNELFLHKGIRNNVSVFISGAERIGTSWCALNMAYGLSQTKHKILFIDGTGNFSNPKANLVLNNTYFLEDYISGKKTLNQIITPYRNKYFDILTGKAGNNYLSEQPLGRIHIFAEDVTILSELYNHTIIDLGATLTEKNLPLCQIAQNILIMCSDNNSDLIKTFDLIKYFNELKLHANYYLILNKVDSFGDGYKIYEKLSKAAEKYGFNCPTLLGIVRFDTRIRDTIRNKELLLSRYSASEAAVDIKNIAKKLLPEF